MKRAVTRLRSSSRIDITKLTPRNEAFPDWDSLADDQKALYARQMEVYAGYCENADWNAGRVIDAVAEMGELDNTLVIYIFGDNGASMEGAVTGSFNELTMQNGIPLTPEQQLALINLYGGLDVWGTDLVAPHYAAAWAWAGNCPFQWGKQVASHLGGTRQGMVIRYPSLIEDRGGLRSQFTHCIDIGPTILELAGLPQPTHVDGIAQEPMHGTSFLHTFADADAEERHTQQYFEIAGYRAMYKDGWWLAQSIPRIPWDLTPATMARFAPGLWQPDDDPVELYYLPDDFTQADDIAAQHPEKVKELRDLATIHVQNKNAVIEPVGIVIAARNLQAAHGEITQRHAIDGGIVHALEQRHRGGGYTLDALGSGDKGTGVEGLAECEIVRIQHSGLARAKVSGGEKLHQRRFHICLEKVRVHADVHLNAQPNDLRAFHGQVHSHHAKHIQPRLGGGKQRGGRSAGSDGVNRNERGVPATRPAQRAARLADGGIR